MSDSTFNWNVFTSSRRRQLVELRDEHRAEMVQLKGQLSATDPSSEDWECLFEEVCDMAVKIDGCDVDLYELDSDLVQVVVLGITDTAPRDLVIASALDYTEL